MPRFLTILKYVPAAFCGLLAVAWVVSGFVEVGIVFRAPSEIPGRGSLKLACSQGSALVWRDLFGNEPLQLICSPLQPSARTWSGKLSFLSQALRGYNYAFCPLPMLVTLFLPLAIGAFNRFRFSLATWFGFTALVALECAYYLR